MRVYWLEQAEKDVPETNGWLCAAEIARLNRLPVCKTPHGLALGTLDGEARGRCPPQLADMPPSTRKNRDSRHSFRRT